MVPETKEKALQDTPVAEGVIEEEKNGDSMDESGQRKINQRGERDDEEGDKPEATVKRPRKEDSSSGEKPSAATSAEPAREAFGRRSSFKPKPNVTAERTAAATPPR